MQDPAEYMALALLLARRGYGATSPNPMVGAVLVKRGQVIGRGWHRFAGAPHGEIEALNDARRRGASIKGADLFVTLEPCSTHGRTPPCTEAVIARGVRRVFVGATDPNPQHAGRAFKLLTQAGLQVHAGILKEQCSQLNEVFNHWIVRRSPFVMVKAAMTMDGKIATAEGESKWITGAAARGVGMRLRQGADAILVGVNTILTDNPSLTLRPPRSWPAKPRGLRRFVLDSLARTPLEAAVIKDDPNRLTTVVVGARAPSNQVAALRKRVEVLQAPAAPRRRDSAGAIGLDLQWLLEELGRREVTSVLVEGGGEVNASFLLQRLAQRVAFFYAPLVLGGRDARRAVAGQGAHNWSQTLSLESVEWRHVGKDLCLNARVAA